MARIAKGRREEHMMHELAYVEDVTREAPATVNENGDLVVTGEFGVLDMHENSIWCSECGRLGGDEYPEHGISDEWQVV